MATGTKNFYSKPKTDLDVARPLLTTMHKMHRACQDNYYSQDFIDSQGEINPVETMTKEELAKLPIRKITPEEAFMLQGFPASFALNGRNAGVADGVLPNQKFSIEVISKDTGITISDKRRNEYLHNSSASDNICLCSFLPSALTI